MSRFDSIIAAADRAFEKSCEKEPTYSPGKPARPSASRYYFLGAFKCVPCGGENECTCESDKEES